jgi:hypothetical protein
MRIALLGCLGLSIAGCSLGPQGEVVRLDGQAVSSYDVDRARNTCKDSDDLCMAALGYGLAPTDRAAAAQVRLQEIAEDNKRRRQMAAIAEENERKRQLALKKSAAKKKRPPRGSGPYG